MKKISVHKIVDHILRCGDIDNRYVDPTVMLDGIRAHKKLQKEYGEGYRAEVPLSIETESGGEKILVEGRADGVFDYDSVLTVHEIKSTSMAIEHLIEQNSKLHLGQAKCYAYMLMMNLDTPPPQINILLTYYHLETFERRDIKYTFSHEELKDFFDWLMREYGVWVSLETDWKAVRNSSIKNTVFPFAEYRKGQREFAVAAYRSIENSKNLYIQAPTGVGKTISSVFPSIKAMGEQICGKLFYLTAKTVTRTVAEEAIALLNTKGLRFKSVTLRAKDKICFCDETICNPVNCEYACGHFDRINNAILDTIQNNDLITPQVIEAFAQKHKVCPFELALDTALWADMVIGDYNHVFDPTVYLKRFFSEGTKSDYVFLIDEAHNLADRVRDMYTVSLQKSIFSRLKRELKEKNGATSRLKKAMGKINTYLLEMKNSAIDKSYVSKERDNTLFEYVFSFCTAANEWLDAQKNSAHPLQKDILNLYFEALAFINISELYDEHYTSITEIFSGNVIVTLYCLDPSDIIAKKLEFAKASIIFSATLTPLEYFRDILGGADNDGIGELPSPFDQKRLLLIAHHGISTKYNDREKNCEPIADAVKLLASNKRGNYLVFFPSFEYMQKVYDVFCNRYPEVDVIMQSTNMSETEREEFLGLFSKDNTDTLIGFCVLGGIFSEGINLEGDRLIGAVIVGVGLPKLSLRQNLIRDYFDEVNNSGYDYAYVFPGMNKVLQAAGRVIRSQSDYGTVLLLDSRFNTPKYRRLYPQHWSHIRMVKNKDELEKVISQHPPLDS